MLYVVGLVSGVTQLDDIVYVVHMLYVVGWVTGVTQLGDIVYVVHMLYVVGSVTGVTQLDDIVYVVHMLYVVGYVRGVTQLGDIVYVVHMLYVVGEVWGVTQLGDIVYVVCRWSPIIKTFTDTLSPLADIYVKGMRDPTDIVVSRDDRQLYIADYLSCIWRVSVDDQSSYVKWLTIESSADRFTVHTLSVTSRRLLVTSRDPQLREYSTTDKRLLRVVKISGYVKELYHGVETTRGTFVIGHEGTSQDKRQTAVSELFSCYNINYTL